jgi:hypothetical protein
LSLTVVQEFDEVDAGVHVFPLEETSVQDSETSETALQVSEIAGSSSHFLVAFTVMLEVAVSVDAVYVV